jgi:anti-sigma factor RsiW
VTCRDVADFLDRYLAATLPSPIVSRFERHLSVCPNCQRYLAHYRDTIALGRSAFEELADTVPADVPHDLVAAILTARTSG